MLAILPFFSLNIGLLGVALVLSGVLVTKLAYALFRGAATNSHWKGTIVSLVTILIASVLTIDGALVVSQGSLAPFAPLPAVALLIVAIPLSWLQVQAAAHLTTTGRAPRRASIAAGALAASLVTGIWASYRLQAELQPRDWDGPVLTSRPLEMQLVTHLVGVSDQGREIHLFRSNAAEIPAERAFAVESQPQGRTSNVITQAAPDRSSNCHGWVFTGGQFMLDSQGLRTILEDNGYAVCTQPQAGDVVVYYEQGDVPVHTGVVSGVLDDGTVIVESKWGTDGRYLHRPDDQPYSSSYAFFRSERGGNEISIRDASSSLARQRLPASRRVRKA